MFNVKDPGEWNGPRARSGVFRIVDGFHLLDKIFRVVIDYYSQRVKHGHHALRALIQVFSDVMFQQPELNGTVGFRNTNGRAEITQCFRRVTPPPNAGESGHTGIVPTLDLAVLNQGEQLSLSQ